MNPYELLGVKPTCTTDQVRNAYKEKAMVHHPDRGGNAVTWSNIQKAYDILSDPQRRAMHDRSISTDGGAEKQFAQSFADGDAPKKTMNISTALDVAKKETQGGSLAHAGTNMSHSQGFEAWLRNQKGLGNTGFYTAEDLLRSKKGGMMVRRPARPPATQSVLIAQAPRLRPLTTRRPTCRR